MGEVATVEQQHDIAPLNTYDRMISIALEKDADIEKLKELMDLKEKYERGEAKKAYFSALSIFQSKLGPIAKKRQAHNSKYADIDDIAQAIRPLLSEVGLSYRFDQQQQENEIIVTCIATHALGHSEQLPLRATPDVSGGKNAIQAMASTITYLRRYSLTGVLGITTGNDDDDGGKPAVTTQELLDYNAAVREHFSTIATVKESFAIEDYSTAVEAWYELSKAEMNRLWKAPTKGGIFTTQERDTFQAKAYIQARNEYFGANNKETK